MHTITIDYRETELLKKCQAFLELANINLPAGSPPVPVNIVSTNLPLGDVIISGSEESASATLTVTDNVDPTASVIAQKVIFERKTLQDLANSIRDGRYAEQSFRLNACTVPNHHVIYIIEGDLRSYRPYNKNSVDKRTLLSAMVSISYYKGFSLYRSLNLEETAEFILQMAAKIARRPNEKAYYASSGCASPACTGTCAAALANNPSNAGYSAVHNGQVKKNNINPTNIGEIMLAQIPGVSTASAVVIMERYKTIPALLVAMQAHPGTVFDNLYVVNKVGQRRRINKTCKTNLFSFLHGGYAPLKPRQEQLEEQSEEDSGHSDDSEEEREREREEEKDREREREEERQWRIREEETVAAVIAAVTANVPAFAAAVAAAAAAVAAGKSHAPPSAAAAPTVAPTPTAATTPAPTAAAAAAPTPTAATTPAPTAAAAAPAPTVAHAPIPTPAPVTAAVDAPVATVKKVRKAAVKKTDLPTALSPPETTTNSTTTTITSTKTKKPKKTTPI